MGPESINALPTRPKFTWDLRSVPWTDGRRDQQGFSTEVKWCAFHDTLKESNANKIEKSQRGLVLHTQLYGRAADLARHLSIEELQKDDAVDKILPAI